GQALQAWSMLHGNPLLRGWSLSDVSFYTTELPEYMLVELVRGLNGDVVHVAAALSYTLMVVLAGLLARGRATGREGLVRVLVAVGIMLAPPVGYGTYLMLSAPDHAGTQVPLLVIWLLLDRARPRPWVPATVALLLAYAQVGDLLVLYECVVPLVIVCAVRMYRRRGPLAGQRYELSLLTAAIASSLVAVAVLSLIRKAGGFVVRTPIAAFSSAAQLSDQFWLKVQSVLQVFGADFFGLRFGTAAIVALVHLVGVGLVACALAVAVRRFIGEDDLIVQLLAAAFFVVLVAYLFGVKPDANEIIGLLPIGAVLSGRLLAGRLLGGGLIPVMAVVLACYGGFLISDATPSPAVSQNELVAPWLVAHHMTYGLAGYWEASSVTVDSGDRVQIRPVRMYQQHLVTTSWESDKSWYDPKRHDAHFVIWAPKTYCSGVCLSMSDLRRIFGPPTATYRVGGYRVLVWRANLLTDVQTLQWCGNAWPWSASTAPTPRACG
ncbi:MAG TPA: hypothetical protein VGP46_11920, partial [Acidimicrobiales bacterium]|nr:hypothetical protein [Acidimicrobiales bacterium]